MRSKDFIRFAIVAAVFLVGLWLWNQQVKQNRPPRKEEETPLTAEQREAIAVGVQDFALPNPIQIAAAAAGREDLAFQLKKEAEAKAADKVRWQNVWAIQLKEVSVAAAKLLQDVHSTKLIQLGSEDPESEYHLGVTLDPRGASVASIVLNKFKAANADGRREDKILTLVPTDDHLRSFLLYHYELDNADASRPFDYLAEAEWEQEKTDSEDTVVFSTQVASKRYLREIASQWLSRMASRSIKITKTFHVPKKAYHIGLEVKIEKIKPSLEEKVGFRYQLTGAHGLPLEGQWYTPTHRHSLIAQVEGSSVWRDYQELGEISLAQGGNEVSPSEDRRLQYAGVAVQYFASVIAVDGKQDILAAARPTLEKRVAIEQLEAPQIEQIESPQLAFEKKLLFPARKDRKAETYLLSEEVYLELISKLKKYRKGARVGLVCEPNASDQLTVIDVLSESESHPLLVDDITVRVKSKYVTVSDDEPVVHKYVLYNGPIKPMLLGQMTGVGSVPDEYVNLYVDDLHLNTLTDYQSRGWIGSFASSIYWTNLLIFFTNLMHRILNLLHFIVPNYGLCIILLTVLVRSMMLPISRKQAYTTMKMQQLAPEIKKLKEKFKDDRQGMAMAQMALFRKHGINPLGSCWLLLLQLPVFMGLYYALQESVHFRLASFLWIDNLAAPDMLFYWGQGFPMLTARDAMGGFLYLGPYFNLLPIVAITLMIMQQKMMMPPPADEQQAAQQKMMRIMMIVFGVLFYKVAAGLCLYFIVSTCWGFAERKLLPKKKLNEPPTETSLDDRPSAPLAPTSTALKAAPSTPGNGEGSRNRRRQERKKRQQEQSRKPADTSAPAASTSGEPGAAPKARDEGGGMFAKLKRWWQNVVKKASKK